MIKKITIQKVVKDYIKLNHINHLYDNVNIKKDYTNNIIISINANRINYEKKFINVYIKFANYYGEDRVKISKNPFNRNVIIIKND